MVEEHAKKAGVSFNKSLAHFAVKPEYQAEFAAYSRRVNKAVLGGK
jgi:hypothetical protein